MRILFYGDSNTYGFDPRDPFDDRYPASVRWTDRLAAALKEAGTNDKQDEADDKPAETNDKPAEVNDTTDYPEVIARGQNGRCVPSLPQMRSYLHGMIRSELPLDYIAIMLGTNDLLRTWHPDAALPAAQMDAFMQFLTNQYPDIRPVLIAPPLLFELPLERAGLLKDQPAAPSDQTRTSRENIDHLQESDITENDDLLRESDITENEQDLPGDPYRFYLCCWKESRRLNNMYRKIAEKYGALFADAGEWHIDMSEDYVHFSERGHAQFAGRMLDFLSSLSPSIYRD